MAADAVDTKHHSAFNRVLAVALWSLDELGLAIFGLIHPWLDDELIPLALDDTLSRKRGLRERSRPRRAGLRERIYCRNWIYY